jgi:hypothetical protein
MQAYLVFALSEGLSPQDAYSLRSIRCALNILWLTLNDNLPLKLLLNCSNSSINSLVIGIEGIAYLT